MLCSISVIRDLQNLKSHIKCKAFTFTSASRSTDPHATPGVLLCRQRIWLYLPPQIPWFTLSSKMKSNAIDCVFNFRRGCPKEQLDAFLSNISGLLSYKPLPEARKSFVLQYLRVPKQRFPTTISRVSYVLFGRKS